MARLRGHATAGPVRWKEPRAFAAADHTSRRPHPGCGRPDRRRVGGECRVEAGRRGTLIHHAAPAAIRALTVAVIEAALGTLLMAAPRGLHGAAARPLPAVDRTVGVAAIAGAADREGRRAGAAGAKSRRVHRVAALRVPGRRSRAAARARMSRDCPGSSLRRVSPRGPGAPTLGPHLAQLSRLPYPSAAQGTATTPPRPTHAAGPTAVQIYAVLRERQQ